MGRICLENSFLCINVCIMEEQTSKMSEETKRVDFVRLYREISRRRWFIVKAVVLGLVAGIVITVSLPKEYTTNVRLAPETERTREGQVMSLATLLGMGGRDESSDRVPAAFYPDIVGSTPFLVSLRDVAVEPEGMPGMSLYEYLVKHQKRAWWYWVLHFPRVVTGWVSGEPETLDEVWNAVHLTETQKRFVDELKDRIVFEKTANENLVSLQIRMQDPVVAARVGHGVVERLENYLVAQRHTKAMKNLRFTREMYETTKDLYGTMEKTREQGAGNKVQLDVDMTLGVFNMLAQQYEMMKLRAEHEQEDFTVIEPASVPLHTSNLSGVVVCAGMMLLFGFVGVMWCLFQFAFRLDYDGK